MKENRKDPFCRTIRMTVVGVFVLSSLLSVSAILFIVLTGTGNQAHDFLSYRAAGKQLIHGANPYAAQAVFALEHTAGFNGLPLVMRNPPTALFVTLPLGFLGVRLGSLLWSILILGCLVASIQLLRDIHGGPRGRLYLIGYLFAPALACIAAGQTGIFLLLGLALFLRFHASHPLIAGMALSLCALKPHLFVPFSAALLAWILVYRAYSMLTASCSRWEFAPRCRPSWIPPSGGNMRRWPTLRG